MKQRRDRATNMQCGLEKLGSNVAWQGNLGGILSGNTAGRIQIIDKSLPEELASSLTLTPVIAWATIKN
jgi:hypothetical protein